MPADMMTIEEFVQLKYPAPNEDDPDHKFFQSWGYEQYLIKCYKYNLEQLCVLERVSYNQYCLGIMLDRANEGTLLDPFKGVPLVRARGILSGFLMQSVPKGAVGVLLWKEDNGDPFCLFPGRPGGFSSLMRAFDAEDLERLDNVFTTEQDVIAMQPTDRVAYIHQLKNRIVDIPELGTVYVTQTWGGNFAGTYYTIQYVPAIPGKSVAWKRKPKARKERATIRKHQLEDARILV